MKQNVKDYYGSSRAYLQRLLRHEGRKYVDYLYECEKGLSSGASVLECGCGTGNSSRVLAEKGFSVTGTDVSSLFIEEAKRRHGAQRGLSFRTEDASALSFPDSSFDLVCSALLMEHVTDVEAVLREMVRVLKPGGKLVIDMPSFLDPFQQLHEFLSWPERSRPRPWEASTRSGALLNFFFYFGIKLSKAAGLNRKIYYLEPVLEEEAKFCGIDYDATWLANSHDIVRVLLGLGMDVSVKYPDAGEGGLVASFLRRFRFPSSWAELYSHTRASGFLVAARKNG